MNPSAQTPLAAPAPRRRRIWPWVLAVLLFPFVVVGIAAFSYLTLNRSAALLRRQVMAASHTDWDTKLQLSVGRFTLGAVGTGLIFAHDRNIEDARLVLAAVKRASVGVYERHTVRDNGSRAQLFIETDRMMRKHGWSRLVGVAEDDGEMVLVYVPEVGGSGDTIDLCVAVVNGKQLVVVSTTVEAGALAQLVEKHAGRDLKRKLHLAKFQS
jgi:hypothetical protein